MFKVTDKRRINDADCVVAMILAKNITPHPTKPGWSVLKTHPVTDYWQTALLCTNERFASQPAAAFGTGFLVSRTIVATARHAIDDSGAASVRDIRFVFGFRMLNDTTAKK